MKVLKNGVWVVIGGVIAVIIATGQGGGNKANAWIDTNGGTCKYNSIAQDYTDADACPSMERAVKAVKKGDTIRIKAGTYPPQMIYNSTPATPPNGKLMPAVIRPADGESVTIGDGSSLNANGQVGNPTGTPCRGGSATSYFYAMCFQGSTSYVELRNLVFYRENTPGPLAPASTTPNNTPPNTDTGRGAIAISDNANPPGPNHLGLTNLNATSLRLDGRLSDINVNGGVYGGTTPTNPEANGSNTALNISAGASGITDLPTRVNIDGAIFQNDNSDVPGDHVECALLNGEDFLTITRSIFRECGRVGGHSTADININRDIGRTDHVTLQNNFFPSVKPDGFFSLNISRTIPNVKLLNNTWARGGPALQDTCTTVGVDTRCAGWQIIGNYGPKPSNCLTGTDAVFAQNAFINGTCGASDTLVGTFDSVDSSDTTIGHNDLHLPSGATALDKVQSPYCPVVDIDNERRNQSTCDAGADER